MAGLVPAISILVASRCARNRDARDKRGHDVERRYTPSAHDLSAERPLANSCVSLSKTNLSPLENPQLYFASLAHRGRRRSRRLMTEQGAAPDNGVAVEPREAQRPTSLAARTPIAAVSGNGDTAVGVLVGREVHPAGCVSLLYEGASQAPGASRRSIPSLRGEGKQGCGPPPGPKKSGVGAAERWLKPLPVIPETIPEFFESS
jgi:hypothetical protein